MTIADDIAKVAEQERALVFPRFDEETALSIGTAIKLAVRHRKLLAEHRNAEAIRPTVHACQGAVIVHEGRGARQRGSGTAKIASDGVG